MSSSRIIIILIWLKKLSIESINEYGKHVKNVVSLSSEPIFNSQSQFINLIIKTNGIYL
jgi:hypothetical protein